MRRGSDLRAVLAVLVLGIGAPALGQMLSADPVLQQDAPADPHRPLAQELRASASPLLSVTAVGSLVLEAPDGAPPPFDAEVRALLTASDRAGAPNVTIGVLETPLIDPAASPAFPTPWADAPALRAAPATAARLKEQGFGALMLASRHALDWGIEGMHSTAGALDEAGIAHAGTGDTASRAAHAAYYDAPAGGGRIAIVSTATTFRPNSQALDQQGAAPGRPGVHGIELAAVRRVSPDQLFALQTASCRFKHLGDPAACAGLEPAEEATLFATTYRAGKDAGAYGTSTHELNVPQANAFLSGIREGKQNADLLVAAIHADQRDDARGENAPVPAFLGQLAHAAVAAGADMVMVTGPAALGPVEIVATPAGTSAPVFYGLGTFASDAQGEGIVVRSVAGPAGLRIELIPLDLSATTTSPEGQPRKASLSVARAVLGRLQALSAPLGTEIAIERQGASAIGVITAPIGAAE